MFKNIKKDINDCLTNSEPKLIYGVVKCAVDKRFEFFIEKDASFFENYDEALKSYISKTLKKLEECKMNSTKNIYTECDVDDAWEEMLCKYNLEYYERLVALKIN
ncbi:hypothetical protein JG677_03080 [Campylobacter sp. TTU-622]|uniref:hypothetical protein n=1 Tax=Campylobacter sp. TTU-622 TaxID=2800583 RepID=UPI0019082B3E|nr:hypothetical protein [Campylobacter sp. TTU-622]MBK1973035.1 hypothetical protein [Campylobacter sp. TTU-622]